MAAIGSFKHYSISTVEAAIDTAYDKDLAHEHVVGIQGAARANILLDGISIRFADIVTATSVIMRLTWDAEGDDIVCPDTEADLSMGLTVTDAGCVVYAFQLPAVGTNADDNTLYLHVRLDAGTANIVGSTITFHE